ncbi:hypothetical protein PIROE2DRAFT_14713 [Piromyces sp. E2]|nr:hypothetical protein PIROE2DRAFT_14713 [Piromyces sp. E2]|eukprot:OUM59685.1 hypothetical protein PIROE2DRAFT_14713 [Piromyces sp. E2]
MIVEQNILEACKQNNDIGRDTDNEVISDIDSILIDIDNHFEDFLSQALNSIKISGNKYLSAVLVDNTCIEIKFKVLLKFLQENNPININIVLGISFPNIFSIFEKVVTSIYGLLDKYYDNESKIFNGEIEIKKYYDNRKKMTDTLKENTFKNEYINSIFQDNEYKGRKIDSNQQKELLKIFFDDYILFYLSKIDQKDFEKKNPVPLNINFFKFNPKILTFFKIFFSLFTACNHISSKKEKINNTDDEIYQYDNIIDFILFTLYYKDFINTIINFIISFDTYLSNYFNNYVHQVSLNMFISDNLDEFYLKKLFNNILESIVYCVINGSLKNKDNNTKEEFTKLLKTFNKFGNTVLKMFDIKSKCLYYSKEIHCFYHYFLENEMKKVSLDDDFLSYLKIDHQYYIISNYENEHNNNNNTLNFYLLKYRNQKDLKDTYPSKEIEYLYDILNCNDENSYSFIMNLMNIKMNIFNEEFVLVHLLNILCNDKFIEHVYSNKKLKKDYNSMFITLFNSFKIEQYNESELLTYLNKTNNEIIEKLVERIFLDKITKSFKDSKNKMDSQYLLIKNIIHNSKKSPNNNNKFALRYCDIFKTVRREYKNKIKNKNNSNRSDSETSSISTSSSIHKNKSKSLSKSKSVSCLRHSSSKLKKDTKSLGKTQSVFNLKSILENSNNSNSKCSLDSKNRNESNSSSSLRTKISHKPYSTTTNSNSNSNSNSNFHPYFDNDSESKTKNNYMYNTINEIWMNEQDDNEFNFININGLKNLGNTCYINAPIQVSINITELLNK